MRKFLPLLMILLSTSVYGHEGEKATSDESDMIMIIIFLMFVVLTYLVIRRTK